MKKITTIRIPLEIVCNPNLNSSSKLLYGLFYSFFKFNKIFPIDVLKLADLFNSSDRTIYKYLGELTAKGLLKKYYTEGRGLSFELISLKVQKELTFDNFKKAEIQIKQFNFKIPVTKKEQEDFDKTILKRENTEALKWACKNILNHLNFRCKRNFRHLSQNYRFITARLLENMPPFILKRIIDYKWKTWKNDKNFKQYLQPSTLFNKTKFENYLEAYISNLPKKLQQSMKKGLKYLKYKN